MRNLHKLFLPLSKAGARAADRDAENPALEAIYRDVVARVPRGRATTYGAVARAAGLPGQGARRGLRAQARAGRNALAVASRGGHGGKIVFPARSSAHREQSRLLRSEGVEVKSGRVAAAAMIDLEEI